MTPPLNEGDLVDTWENFERLPIGTHVRSTTSYQQWWEKVDDNVWMDRHGSRYTSDQFSMGRYLTVVSLPAGVAAPPSLLGWQFKFLDHVWWSTEQAGVEEDTVFSAMERLGLVDSMFPVGAGLRIRSRYWARNLPEGTLAYTATPEDEGHYGLFQAQRQGEPVRVLGVARAWYGMTLTVHSTPNGSVADWQYGTEEDRERIAEFKARAWRVGWKAKIAHSWCNSYESYMEQIGLTKDVLTQAKSHGVSPGDRVDPLGAAMLPEGTTLRWRSTTNDTFTWHVRDNAAQNAARTRFLFGTAASQRAYRSSMEVVAFGDITDYEAPITAIEADHLPVGSRIVANDVAIVRCRDGSWTYWGENQPVPAHGSWNTSQISVTSLTSVSHV